MQGLWLSMGRIDEAGMCRAEVSGELVHSVVSNKDTGRDVQHAVFRIEVLNGGMAAGRVAFAKDFLKVALQKINNSIIHNSNPRLLCRRSTAADATVLAKYIAASMSAKGLGFTKTKSDLVPLVAGGIGSETQTKVYGGLRKEPPLR
jgi:hypothetical protein